MKTLVFLLIAIFATASSFAQKSKANDITKNASVVIETYACPMHPDVVSDKPGKCSKCGMDLNLSAKEQLKREVTHYYTCPMHNEVISLHEGICAKCSSTLVVDRRGSKQAFKTYSCSMHSQFASNESGKCPVCGRKLKEQKTIKDGASSKS